MNNADTRQNMAAQRARAERTQPGLSLIALASCLLLLLAFPVYAQKTSGQITGEVVDQSGAARRCPTQRSRPRKSGPI